MIPSTPSKPPLVAALYRFCRIADPAALVLSLLERCRALGIRGTILVAPEGINGTVAGGPDSVTSLLEHIRALDGFADLTVKFSNADDMPFHRMKVRLKKEIVTMGVAGIDPLQSSGTYVAPADWNAIATDTETVVIDTRNAYEVALGSFPGALDPATADFRGFPAWADRNLDALKGRKVAMFCTGGIRCEKATAYLKSRGVENVFHLQGGILNYLEKVPAEQSLWQGECFVFDERVSVGQGLSEGQAQLCRACRFPLTEADRASEMYEEGVSCPHCFDKRTEADRARYAERHRQVKLAEARGKRHIGS